MSRTGSKHSSKVLYVAALVIGATVVLDWLTPRGYAVWLLYVIAVLLAPLAARRRSAYVVAIICSFLIVAGFFLSPPGIKVSVSIFNRVFGIGTLWIVAMLVERRSRQERLLSESEERFRTLITATSSVVYRMNADWSEMRQLRGRNFLADTEKPERDWLAKYIHQDDRSDVMAAINEAIRTRSILELEHRVLRVDGTLGWTLSRAIPLLDAEGEIFEWFGAASDITERKRAEEALQESNEELAERTAELAAKIEEVSIETAERLKAMEALHHQEQMLLQQSRLAAMGEMIGNIAHQWRQPLNMLGLTIQELKVHYKLGDLTGEILDETVKNAMVLVQHMSKTIEDFRNYFSPDKEKVDFNVHGTVVSTLALLEGSLKARSIAVEVKVTGEPTIHGHHNEFIQVLLNIVKNALDELSERGIPDPKVTISVGSEEGRCIVTISDNAGGIPEEIIDKVFDPYFTTKGPQQGTGIGLYMSKMIIEKNMGGRLTACNTAQGAQFRIEI